MVGSSAAEAEIRDQLLIFPFVLALEVIQQFATLGNEFQKSATRREILLMKMKMLGKVENALGQKSNLIGGASGVSFVGLIRLEVDVDDGICAHGGKGWVQRSSPNRPSCAE